MIFTISYKYRKLLGKNLKNLIIQKRFNKF